MTDDTTSTFEASMTLVHEDGTEDPVEVSIKYPKHRGICVPRAVNQLNDNAEPIVARLAHSGDKSVCDALAGAGLAAHVEEAGDDDQ